MRPKQKNDEETRPLLPETLDKELGYKTYSKQVACDIDPEAPSSSGSSDIIGDLDFIVNFSDDIIDKSNPRHFSMPKKLWITFAVSQLSLILTFSSAVTAAASPAEAEHFGISSDVASLNNVAFLIALGLGAVPFAPLSELVGRQPVYVVTLIISSIFDILAGLATNYPTLVIFRALAGFFGAPPLSNAGGTIHDICDPTLRTYLFPFFAASSFLGPSLGPLIGSYLVVDKRFGWRWCYFITALWGFAIAALVYLTVPETKGPIILKRKAEVLRKETGDERWMTPEEIMPIKIDYWKSIYSPIILGFTEPTIMAFTFYITVSYIVLFGDLKSYPLIFEQYHLSHTQYGLSFAPIMAGTVLCVILGTPFVGEHYKRAARNSKNSVPPPEVRLAQLKPTSFLFPLSIFWLATTSDPSRFPVWVPALSGIPFGMVVNFIWLTTYSYMVDAYGANASSALAFSSFVRYVVAGVWVLFTRRFFVSFGLRGAQMVLGGLALALCAIPFVFSRYGRKIRMWSKGSVHDN